MDVSHLFNWRPAVGGGSKHTDSTNPGLKAGSYPTICVYKEMLQVIYFAKRIYLKSGRRNHWMVKYFGKKKLLEMYGLLERRETSEHHT